MSNASLNKIMALEGPLVGFFKFADWKDDACIGWREPVEHFLKENASLPLIVGPWAVVDLQVLEGVM